MKIAVINETSAADKNKDIIAALEGRGHEIINAGMTQSGAKPELTYIHTGFMAALLLNANRVDMVVGGCGTWYRAGIFKCSYAISKGCMRAYYNAAGCMALYAD